MSSSDPSPVRSRSFVVPMLVLGLSLVAGAALISKGYVDSKKVDDQYSAAAFVGQGKRTVESDHAKWSLALTRSASTTEEATGLIDKDREALKKLVAKAGIADADYSFHPVTSQAYNDYYGYEEGQPSYRPNVYASQIIVIESKQAAALGELSQNTQAQLPKGAQLRTDKMEFTYSKLDDLQKELTKEALKDAREQASELLGDQLGDLRSLERPVISILPENSQDPYGYNSYKDTASIKKDVTVTVSASYHLK